MCASAMLIYYVFCFLRCAYDRVNTSSVLSPLVSHVSSLAKANVDNAVISPMLMVINSIMIVVARISSNSNLVLTLKLDTTFMELANLKLAMC